MFCLMTYLILGMKETEGNEAKAAGSKCAKKAEREREPVSMQTSVQLECCDCVPGKRCNDYAELKGLKVIKWTIKRVRKMMQSGTNRK